MKKILLPLLLCVLALFATARASAVTGAGIGLGVAHRLKADTFVLVSAAVAGQSGAYASALLAGTAVVTHDGAAGVFNSQAGVRSAVFHFVETA